MAEDAEMANSRFQVVISSGEHSGRRELDPRKKRSGDCGAPFKNPSDDWDPGAVLLVEDDICPTYATTVLKVRLNNGRS